MARELKTWPLLDGFRGRPKADVAALVDAIVAFSRLAAALGDRLVEAEINPVFVLAPGPGRARGRRRGRAVIAGGLRSIGPDIGRLDHLGPVVGVRGDRRREFSRGHRPRSHAGLRGAVAHLRRIDPFG